MPGAKDTVLKIATGKNEEVRRLKELIDKKEAVAVLEAYRNQTTSDHRMAAAQKCIERIKELTPIAYQQPKARKVSKVEPFFPGGETGRLVARCSRCRARVADSYNYCPSCGRMFAEEEKKDGK